MYCSPILSAILLAGTTQACFVVQALWTTQNGGWYSGMLYDSSCGNGFTCKIGPQQGPDSTGHWWWDCIGTGVAAFSTVDRAGYVSPVCLFACFI